MTQPQNFHGAPAHFSTQQAVPVTPIQQLPVVARPAPAVVAQLTVRANGDVTLTKPLMAALPRLRPGHPVDLVPPMRRGGTWYLDTRPTAPRRLSDTGKGFGRFAIPSLRPEHLLRPAPATAGAFGSAQGTAGEWPALSFTLGEEVQEEVCVPDAAGRMVCGLRGTGYFALVKVAR